MKTAQRIDLAPFWSQSDKVSEIKPPLVDTKTEQIDLIFIQYVRTKNLEEKDEQRLLLYYVSLIRACNKVLYQLVYIGKKFIFLKKNLGI